jgi:hypothetical protein
VVFAALFGMSADTRARKVGAAAEPVVGPASTVLADSVFAVTANVPLVVNGDPVTVNQLGIVSPTDVNPLPPAPGQVIQEIVPLDQFGQYVPPLDGAARRVSAPLGPPTIMSPAVVIGLFRISEDESERSVDASWSVAPAVRGMIWVLPALFIPVQVKRFWSGHSASKFAPGADGADRSWAWEIRKGISDVVGTPATCRIPFVSQVPWNLVQTFAVGSTVGACVNPEVGQATV